MQIHYSPKLKEYSRQLRNKSTLGEVLLWQQLRARQIMGYGFNRQKPVGNYILDFYCQRLKLAIEVEGSSHFDKLDYDNKREEELNKMGITVLRFGDMQVKHNIESVLLEIKEWIKENE